MDPKTTVFEDGSAILAELMTNPIARRAYRMNSERRDLAESLETARATMGITIDDLAQRASITSDQVRQVLHHDVGGTLTLDVIVSVTDVLGLTL